MPGHQRQCWDTFTLQRDVMIRHVQAALPLGHKMAELVDNGNFHTVITSHCNTRLVTGKSLRCIQRNQKGGMRVTTRMMEFAILNKVFAIICGARMRLHRRGDDEPHSLEV